jgi:hypothetical protein
MTSFYEIPVPGTFASGPAVIDLETTKVPAPDGFRMPNGEPLRRRWSVVMAGIARDGMVTLIDSGSELDRLSEIGELLAGATEVRYGATREFDEMICRGRFTNARRAHLPAPAFPAVPGAEELPWRNVRKLMTPDAPRGEDVESYRVSESLAAGEWEAVAVHLLRDIVELIRTLERDAECEAWCRRVLADFDFALSEVYSGVENGHRTGK